MNFSNSGFRWVVGGILGLALFFGLDIAYQRVLLEAQPGQVDVAVLYRDVLELSARSGVDDVKILTQLSQEAGVSSVVVDEDTLGDFIERGQVTLLKGSEIMNMLRVGHAFRTVLVHLSKSTKVRADRYYLVVDEFALYERIKDFLNISLDRGSVKERGWNIIEIIAEKEALMGLGFGVSDSLVGQIQGLGYSVILRYQNHELLSDSLVALKLRDLGTIEGIDTVMFRGGSVLGYPNLLEEATEHIQDAQVRLGFLELDRQKGAQDLALELGNDVVRTHLFKTEDMHLVPPEMAVRRYVRAAKERGVKLLVVRPLYGDNRAMSLYDANLAFYQRTVAALGAFGFSVVPQSQIQLMQGVDGLGMFSSFVLSAGVLIFVFLLMRLFVRLRPRLVLGTLGLFGLILGYCLVIGDGLILWHRVMALVVALVFPTYAILRFFPNVLSVEQLPEKRIGISALSFLKIFAVGALGAVFLVGFMSDLSYLLGVRLFFGVKLSFVIPLLLVGGWVYLYPYRLKSVYYVLKRVFSSQISLGSFLALGLCVSLAGVYILKSGNYLKVPLFEQMMRDGIESLLFVRPRLKEFVIGYPMLMIGLLFAGRSISSRWIWFFAVLGTMGLVSLINSFCHVYTPISISLYRSVLGVLFGGLFAGGYMLVFGALRWAFRRMGKA